MFLEQGSYEGGMVGDRVIEGQHHGSGVFFLGMEVAEAEQEEEEGSRFHFFAFSFWFFRLVRA